MPIPVADIRLTTKDTLQQFVGISEDETLDFKRDSYGTNDRAKQELCKDVSAMANTRGGDIVLGVAEQDNVATEVAGLEVNIADEIQRLKNIVMMAVEPRIGGIEFQPVVLGLGRQALIIRVPSSLDTPHRVTHSGINRFCVRHGGDTYDASLGELRQMFERSSNEFDRAEEFTAERMAKFRTATEVVRLSKKEEGLAVLHMVPFGFHKRNARLDLSLLEGDQTFAPIGTSGAERLYVPDGFVVRRGDRDCYGYTAVMRTGALEATKANLFISLNNHDRLIRAKKLRTELLDAVGGYLSDFRRYGLQGPWLVGLTIDNCANARIIVSQGQSEADIVFGSPLAEPRLSLPIVVIEGSPDASALEQALKPVFDAMWQAAGLPKSD
jgi:hypothetical protein